MYNYLANLGISSCKLLEAFQLTAVTLQETIQLASSFHLALWSRPIILRGGITYSISDHKTKGSGKVHQVDSFSFLKPTGLCS